MKLQGKAYFRRTETGAEVMIDTDNGVPMVIAICYRPPHVCNDGSAENLCLSLNNWRESYGYKTANQILGIVEDVLL